jgi:hypothetical protein
MARQSKLAREPQGPTAEPAAKPAVPVAAASPVVRLEWNRTVFGARALYTIHADGTKRLVTEG